MLAAVLIRAEHVTRLCWMCLGMQLKSNVNVQAMTFESDRGTEFTSQDFENFIKKKKS